MVIRGQLELRCAVKNILVPVDFSDVTDRVIEQAAKIAAAFSAKIWLLHCVNQYPAVTSMNEVPMVMPVGEIDLPEHFPAKHEQLQQLLDSLQGRGIIAQSLFVTGSTRDEIMAAADRHLIDLIVMGSHGHGALYDLMVGSVTKSILQDTHIPVLVVPTELKKVKVSEAVVASATAPQWEEPMATPY